MKRAACLLAAALLLFALALPAFADETTSVPDIEGFATIREGQTLALPSESETAPITAAPTTTPVSTAAPAVATVEQPIAESAAGLLGAYTRAEAAAFGALALSLLALLLAVIALAKSGKKPGKSAAGNYQKYF